MSLIKRTADVRYWQKQSQYERARFARETGARMKAEGYSSEEIGTFIKNRLGTRPGPKTPHKFVKVWFTGIKELDDKFASLNESLQKKALRKATRAVAKMVLAEAKAEVRHDTGLLERSLKVKAKKRSRKYPQTVGLTVGFEDDLFKGDTYYAGFLEFGTEQRRTKKNPKDANRGRIDEGKFDFLRPALWSYPEKKQAIFREEILKWIREQQLKGVMT